MKRLSPREEKKTVFFVKGREENILLLPFSIFAGSILYTSITIKIRRIKPENTVIAVKSTVNRVPFSLISLKRNAFI